MSTLKLTIPMSPGLLAVNRKAAIHHIGGHARIGTASAYQSACDEAELHIRSAVNRARWKTLTGPCEVTITTHTGARSIDVDATLKSVLDALQHGGVFVNDSQVSTLIAHRTRRAAEPRIEIVVRPLEA